MIELAEAQGVAAECEADFGLQGHLVVSSVGEGQGGDDAYENDDDDDDDDDACR